MQVRRQKSLTTPVNKINFWSITAMIKLKNLTRSKKPGGWYEILPELKTMLVIKEGMQKVIVHDL